MRGWFNKTKLRLKAMFRRRQIDLDLQDEVEFHLAMREQKIRAGGVEQREARYAARRQFGNVSLMKERSRQIWAFTALEEFGQDLRYGMRMLRKNPGFALAAILTLALGIAANTTIFSVVDTVLLRPLPFPEPDQLIWLNGQFPQSDEAAVSGPDFLDYRASNRSFSGLVAMGFRAGPANLVGDRPEQVLETFASANFLQTLGVQPLLGRDFQPADELVKEPQVAILGYGLWKRDFAGSPEIIGRNIRCDGQTLTIVGVLPRDLPLVSAAELWVPAPFLAAGMQMRLAHFLKVIGRLKPGVNLAQAKSDLDGIAARLATRYPQTNRGWSLRQRPLAEVLVGPVRPALLLIWGAVVLLLLIACANVANLQMARSIARHREFAIRASLGASRGRMIRQTLTESVVLAVCGGALGIVAAAGGIDLLRAAGPQDLPRLADVHINRDVLLFSAVVSLLTGLLFGLIPAFQVSRRGLSEQLKESGRSSASEGKKRFRSVLVAAEIAVSLTLLIGAGLLLKSFWLLLRVNPGFQTAHAVTTRLSLGGPAYRSEAQRAQFWRQLEERISAIPGVEAAGATSELPLSGEHSDCPFYIDGRSYGASEYDDANCRQVTPGYLLAMRIPLLAGRLMDARDTAAAAGILLVNEAFANRYFDGRDAIGKNLRLLGDPMKSREIVGIVSDISHSALSDPQRPEMYAPYAQFSPPSMNLVVRSSGDPERLAAALRDNVAGIDKEEAMSTVRSMEAVKETSVAQPRFASQLIALFAGLAQLLAVVGLYGLMAYTVSQRTNEIGIRMALGASPPAILRMALSQGLRLAVAGCVLGAVGALFLTRLLRELLFRVSATDPLTFAGVTVLLLCVALLAAYIPARRATRIDPVIALRYE